MSGSGFDCPQPDSPVRYDSRRNYRAGGDNRPATTNTLVEDITTWMARAGIDNPRGELPTPDHGAFARFLEGAEKLLLQSTRKKRSALTEKKRVSASGLGATVPFLEAPPQKPHAHLA